MQPLSACTARRQAAQSPSQTGKGKPGIKHVPQATSSRPRIPPPARNLRSNCEKVYRTANGVVFLSDVLIKLAIPIFFFLSRDFRRQFSPPAAAAVVDDAQFGCRLPFGVFCAHVPPFLHSPPRYFKMERFMKKDDDAPLPLYHPSPELRTPATPDDFERSRSSSRMSNRTTSAQSRVGFARANREETMG
jgi:hypothetical protein